MSRKRFATMVAVVLLMGAAGLLSLYMTLGRMSAALRSQGRAPAAEAPDGGEKIEQLTLTPAGESQLRSEQERVRDEQARAAGAPSGGATGAAGSPAGASGAPTAATSGVPTAGAPQAPTAATPGVPAAAAPAPAKPAGASGPGGH